MQSSNQSENNIRAFQKAFRDKDIIFQFLDMFPYMVEIFAPDGTSVFINRAACNEMNIADVNQVIGHYNVFNDPVVNNVLGQREFVERAFKGEILSASEVRVPYEDLAVRYTQKNADFSEIKFQEISAFPIRDENRQIAYIVMIFHTTNTYKGKTEIVKAQEYMNKNWLEEYEVDKIAAAAGLSSYHFSRLFKQHTGNTPYTYYKQIKINKIKEKLCDPTLSVAEAFAACGLDYRGRYKQFFRDTVGMTPSKYREAKLRTH